MAVTRAELFFYGQLAFPLAFAGLPLYVLAPDYYVTDHGLTLAFTGIALMLVRLGDAVIDPWIGRMSDQMAARRHHIMAAAALVFALSFFCLYHTPAMAVQAWFVTMVALATISFSTILINLNAAGALLASDDAGQARVSGWREAFGVAGLLFAVTLPSVLGDMRPYAILTAVWMILSAALFLWWMRRVPALSAPQTVQKASSLLSLVRGRFARFFAVYGVSMLASSLPAVLVVFYIRDHLGAEAQTGLFLALYFVSAIVAMPLWRMAAARFGNVRLWRGAMVLSAASIACAALLSAGDVMLYGLVCVVSGAAFGAELYLPPAILSAMVTGAGRKNESAAFFGVYALFMKLALAGAGAGAFLALDIAGFVPATDNEPCARTTLVAAYALAPALIKMAAVLILAKTGGLDEKNVQTNDDRSSHGAR